MPNLLTYASASRKRAILLSAFFVSIALIGVALWYVHASNKSSEESGAADDSNGVGVLLDLAATALHDHRLVAPEGSNVYEFDLSALQLDPHNKKALSNLHASFEPACHTVEEAIANGELDEAERELRLLRDYGAQQPVQQDSYKVSLLGSYLYAQRTVLIRKHEAKAFEMQGGKSSGGAN